MIPNEYQEAFFSGKRGNVVKYCVNDSVVIITGQHKGKGCAVISIEQIEPEVILLVERGDTGESLIINQNDLEMLGN